MATDAPTSAEMVADRIPAARAWAPHETRIYALQVAVEFVNGDARKASNWKAEEVVVIARTFEKYLTEIPISGFETDADPDADDPAGRR